MEFTARDRLRLLVGGAALTLTACGGGSSSAPPVSSNPPPPPPPPPPAGAEPMLQTLKEAWSTNFDIGAAMTAEKLQAGNAEGDLLLEHFTSITAEYEMKADQITQAPGDFDFAVTDQIVDFAENNNMEIRGHALLWYQSTPSYMVGATPMVMQQNLEDFIEAYVGRYKGRIKVWDVVNEPTTDNPNDATAPYRNDDWYAGVGKDYLDWAFNAARQADPDATLFLNDYNTELPGKRGRFISIIQDLLDRGIPVDGIGHQMHVNYQTPIADILAALDAVDDLGAGLEQHITELDISVYNDPGSCLASGVSCRPDLGSSLSSVSNQIQREQMNLYKDIFQGASERDSVTSVTLWGVSDATTWLNTWPVTRSNHPLLFDRNFDPKPPAYGLTDPDYTF